MAERITAELVNETEAAPAASSCGLDFWYSPPAFAFTADFLRGRPATLRVSAGARRATVPCLLRRLPAGLQLASVYPYTCIAGDVALFWSAGKEIRAALMRHGVVRLELPFSGEYQQQLPEPLPRSSRAHVARGIGAVRHLFDFSGVASDEELEQGFHPNIRWAMRKALRSGCSVRNATAQDVDTIQALYAATMRAKHAPVNYGPERWAVMLGDLAARGAAEILIGEVDGAAAGIAAYVDAAESRHFIQLAVPPQFQARRLSELLVATALRGCLARGKRFFDFMASPLSDTGLIAFKAKWGTRAEPISHVVLPGVPLLSPLIDLARWANRMRARQPW
jgi:hypothetical protein